MAQYCDWCSINGLDSGNLCEVLGKYFKLSRQLELLDVDHFHLWLKIGWFWSLKVNILLRQRPYFGNEKINFDGTKIIYFGSLNNHSKVSKSQRSWYFILPRPSNAKEDESAEYFLKILDQRFSNFLMLWHV